MTRLVRLSAGPLEMALCPAVGGSIASFGFLDGGRSVPIMRGAEGMPENVLAAASFPLVPFVNRIRGGRFIFRGRTISLQPNMPGDPSPLHGQGWLGHWQVESATSGEARLEFEHAADEWPWAYVARQRFRLDPAGLSIDLSCRNLSADPMPCGLGQHPYFHCTPDTRLQTGVDHVWTIDENVLPVERIAAAGPYALADKAVCGAGLDHGFDGWSGKAIVSDPAWPFRLTMSSPTARFFQLYSPGAGGIFVIEPVTHANAALNEPEDSWAGLGLRILMPGDEMTLAVRFDLS